MYILNNRQQEQAWCVTVSAGKL